MNARRRDKVDGGEESLQGRFPVHRLKWIGLNMDEEEKNDDCVVMVSVKNREEANRVLEDWIRIFPNSYRAVVGLGNNCDEQEFEKRFLCRKMTQSLAPMQSFGMAQDVLEDGFYGVAYSEYMPNRTRMDRAKTFCAEDIIHHGSLHLIPPEAWIDQIAYLHNCIEKYGA
jgi:hypothetical protein